MHVRAAALKAPCKSGLVENCKLICYAYMGCPECVMRAAGALTMCGIACPMHCHALVCKLALCMYCGHRSEGVIRLLIKVFWRNDHTDTKSSVVNALKLLKGWAGGEDAACAFCCLLISRGSADDSGRMPAVTFKRMLDEVSTQYALGYLQTLNCRAILHRM